jgi:chromosome segregation ATPase
LHAKVVLLAEKAKELKPARGKKADCQRKIKHLANTLEVAVGVSERLTRMIEKCKGQLEEVQHDSAEQEAKVISIRQQLSAETDRLQGFDHALADKERAHNAPHLKACISE